MCIQVAGNLQLGANNSLNNYLNDQSVQDSWNSAQQSVSIHVCFAIHVHAIDAVAQ